MKQVFSPLEKQIIHVLGRRKMTINEITEQIYDRSMRLDANNTVAGAVRRINKKADFHKLTWHINSVGLGRGGKTVWKEKK